MEEAKLQVKIITPTIMGGANSKELDPDFIRPTEIKSIMRQAFRLVAGRYIEHNGKGIKKLYELESEVFGNTEKNGKFRLVVEGEKNLKTERIKLLPHKNDFSKSAILQNQTFDLKIISYKHPVEFYKALLNIAFLLGVGFKRNRLFGNLQIENFNLAEEVKKIDNFFLEKELKEIKTDEPLFACLSKRTDENRNYIAYSIPLEDKFKPIDKLQFEKALKSLYEKVIHEVEKIKINYILGKANPRQASYINFSILKYDKNYKLFILGFYYKNNDFNYNQWKEAVEKVKKLTEQTFIKK